MYDKYRQYIYKNKIKFDLNYNIDESLPEIEIDLSKTYTTNKKKIEKALGSVKVSGIWIIEDFTKNLKKGESVSTYEVLSTANILQEMVKDLQFIYLGERDAKKNIYGRYSKNVYRRYKYQQIYKSSKSKTKRGLKPILIFKQVVSETSKEEREKIELKIALDKKAVWWSSNPDQSKIIKESLGVGEEEFIEPNNIQKNELNKGTNQETRQVYIARSNKRQYKKRTLKNKK